MKICWYELIFDLIGKKNLSEPLYYSLEILPQVLDKVSLEMFVELLLQWQDINYIERFQFLTKELIIRFVIYNACIVKVRSNEHFLK